MKIVGVQSKYLQVSPQHTKLLWQTLEFFENDQKHLHSATFGKSLHDDVFWKIIKTHQMSRNK